MKLNHPIYLYIILSLSATSAAADSFFDQFIDPQDGQLDISQMLASKTGFLPVPIIISDPAVGYGGGLAAAFFHDSKEEQPETSDANAPLSLPPSVSFLAGAYTDNDSWFAGGGHLASWKSDTIRYLGVAGYGDFNLKFYGVSADANPDDQALNFNIKGLFLLQEALFRIKESNFFVGGRYSYLNSDVQFNLFDDIPEIPAAQFDSSTGGLGLLLRYDSRDSIVSPNKGHYAKLETMFYNKAFGGDFNYTKTKLSSNSYWPISDVVLGLRLEGDFTSGDVPFYDAPYIDMRGLPAMRYQGEDVVVGEVEARWDVTPRWSLVGFVGSGWTADSIGEPNDQSGIVAGGGGVRYLIARRLGLRVGMDVATGPEETVFYMAVGGSWN